MGVAVPVPPRSRKSLGYCPARGTFRGPWWPGRTFSGLWPEVMGFPRAVHRAPPRGRAAPRPRRWARWPSMTDRSRRCPRLGRSRWTPVCPGETAISCEPRKRGSGRRRRRSTGTWPARPCLHGRSEHTGHCRRALAGQSAGFSPCFLGAYTNANRPENCHE